MSKGRFAKGNIPWNKDKKGIRLSPDTEFKKGIHTMENSPSWKGGIQISKNDCAYISIGTNKRIRLPRKIYEDNYGSIPKGYVIWHIDGDKHNDNADNLEAISRAESMKRNSIKRISRNKTH